MFTYTEEIQLNAIFSHSHTIVVSRLLSENIVTRCSDSPLQPKYKIGYVIEGFCFLAILYALWNTHHLTSLHSFRNQWTASKP
jgi:hypothetical protein